MLETLFFSHYGVPQPFARPLLNSEEQDQLRDIFNKIFLEWEKNQEDEMKFIEEWLEKANLSTIHCAAVRGKNTIQGAAEELVAICATYKIGFRNPHYHPLPLVLEHLLVEFCNQGEGELFSAEWRELLERIKKSVDERLPALRAALALVRLEYHNGTTITVCGTGVLINSNIVLTCAKTSNYRRPTHVRLAASEGLPSSSWIVRRIKNIDTYEAGVAIARLALNQSSIVSLPNSYEAFFGDPAINTADECTVVYFPSNGQPVQMVATRIEHINFERLMHALRQDDVGELGAPIFDISWRLVGVFTGGYDGVTRLAARNVLVDYLQSYAESQAEKEKRELDKEYLKKVVSRKQKELDIETDNLAFWNEKGSYLKKSEVASSRAKELFELKKEIEGIEIEKDKHNSKISLLEEQILEFNKRIIDLEELD